MRCPKCRTLTLVPAGVAGDAGRLVRCPRCPETWISRPGGDALSADPVRPPMIRKAPLTIEGDYAPARRRPRAGRAGLFATVAIFALALAAVVTLSPRVSAGADIPRAEALR